MALFGLFGRKQEPGIDWVQVASGLSGLLWTAMNTDPKMVASPFARVILRGDSSVYLANDRRDPAQILQRGDVSFAFVREDSDALAKWVEELKLHAESPRFQQIATEEFAKNLTRILMRTGT